MAKVERITYPVEGYPEWEITEHVGQLRVTVSRTDGTETELGVWAEGVEHYRADVPTAVVRRAQEALASLCRGSKYDG